MTVTPLRFYWDDQVILWGANHNPDQVFRDYTIPAAKVTSQYDWSTAQIAPQLCVLHCLDRDLGAWLRVCMGPFLGNSIRLQAGLLSDYPGEHFRYEHIFWQELGEPEPGEQRMTLGLQANGIILWRLNNASGTLDTETLEGDICFNSIDMVQLRAMKYPYAENMIFSSNFREFQLYDAQLDPITDPPTDDTPLAMPTPYVNQADMGGITEAYSSDNSAPWGFTHNGVDFFPTRDLAPFQAVCDGQVGQVENWLNEGNGNWQVSVSISCGRNYRVIYAFEPMSSSQADGQTQLNIMQVVEGQEVRQGDIIGLLFRKEEGAHVHFSLLRYYSDICPENHFTPQARESILSLLHQVWPGAAMCY